MKVRHKLTVLRVVALGSTSVIRHDLARCGLRFASSAVLRFDFECPCDGWQSTMQSAAHMGLSVVRSS